MVRLSEIILDDKASITEIVNAELDRAERLWKELDESLIIKADSRASIDTNIPGHTTISETESVVDKFVALVVDIRNSSDHLLCATSKKHAKVSGIERVFYETSALLPAVAHAILQHEGEITEYLGDGLLALFRANHDINELCYKLWDVCELILFDYRDVVNNILYKRYSLPSLDIGVGLAYSQALVVAIGHYRNRHGKAIGECVYRASKLSSGNNRLYIDERLKALWPKRKDGKGFSFRSVTARGNVKGFEIPIHK
jgi:class 3 adenylate cyclase